MTILRDRKSMPQIRNHDKFIEDLNSNDIQVLELSVTANTLNPTQNEFNDEKVQSIIKSDNNTFPIITTKDNYILDGHHRWKANLETSQNQNIKQVQMNFNDLFDFVADKDYVEYKSINESIKCIVLKKDQDIFQAFTDSFLTLTSKYYNNDYYDQLCKKYITFENWGLYKKEYYNFTSEFCNKYKEYFITYGKKEFVPIGLTDKQWLMIMDENGYVRYGSTNKEYGLIFFRQIGFSLKDLLEKEKENNNLTEDINKPKLLTLDEVYKEKKKIQEDEGSAVSTTSAMSTTGSIAQKDIPLFNKKQENN